MLANVDARDLHYRYLAVLDTLRVPMPTIDEAAAAANGLRKATRMPWSIVGTRKGWEIRPAIYDDLRRLVNTLGDIADDIETM